MGDDYGNDFITITDDDGNEFELEHLETIEHEGNIYMAFLPADMSEDDEEYGMVLLKSVTENGDDVLVTIDDESESDAVHEKFISLFSDDSDE